MNNLVSVITSTFNSSDYIEETIQSVLKQTYENFEFIITDDQSSDNTFDILEKWASRDSRIKLSQLKANSGAGIARNNSISLSNGRYIAFLDSDDKWLPNKLFIQIKFMQQYGLDLSYSSYYLIDTEGKRVGESRIWKDHLTYKDLLNNNYIGCLTGIYDSATLGKIFLPEIRKRQDWGLWLKISKITNKIGGIDDLLAEYRLRTDSVSSGKIGLLKYNWKIYREVERFSILKSLNYMARFLYFFFKKKV